jgi:hypothetical protein
MSRSNILIIEDRPVYAASLMAQFMKWGFQSVNIIAASGRSGDSIARLKPSLILANLDLKHSAEVLKAGCPVIFFKIHDGSLVNYLQPTTILKNYSRIDLPCLPEELEERVGMALGIRLPVQ